jgi:GT2 family glycosyltransferase
MYNMPNNQQTSNSGEFASIITVNFNTWHKLNIYIPSVLQSKGNFEIIISDNGSTDGSIKFIKTLYKDILVIENGTNIGFAEANNRAVRFAKGEILVFINPDTTVDPNWLVHLLEPFNDPNVGLVTPKILLMQQPDQINACGNVFHISGIAQCRGLNESQDNYCLLEEVDAISGAAFAIRHKLFDQLMGFDKDFFLYMEDTDLSIRARLAGWQCIYQPESIVYHDYKLRFGPRKIYLQERNRYMLILKNYLWPTIITLLPILIVTEMVTWGFSIMRDFKNISNKINAYRWIISNWSLVMRKRKINQSLRKVKDREIIIRSTYKLNYFQVSGKLLSILSNIIFNSVFGMLKIIEMLIIWW